MASETVNSDDRTTRSTSIVSSRSSIVAASGNDPALANVDQGEMPAEPTPPSKFERPAQTVLASKHKFSAFTWFATTSSDSWVPEIVAVVFSLLCLMAIIITLAVFNDKPRPDLTRHLTFNTIIAILSTGTRSSLTYATASILGQKKWTWFKSRPRLLKDVQTIDEASRGPMGSSKLLFGRIALSTASLGALITILALAFDPFVQQLIDFPLGPVPISSANATARRASFIPELGGQPYPRFTDVKDAVALGTFSNYFPQNPTCPSRNCTWPAVRSVSWCTNCEDITHQAKIMDCDPPYSNNYDAYTIGQPRIYNCNVSLPDVSPSPVVLNATLADKGYLDMSYSYDMVRKLSPIDKDNQGSDFEPAQRVVLEMGYFDIEPHPTYGLAITQASKCGLAPCLNTYSLSVEDGQEHTELVNSTIYQSRLRKLPRFEKELSLSPLQAATCFELDDSPKDYTDVTSWISELPAFIDADHDAWCMWNDWPSLNPAYYATYTWASPFNAWMDPLTSAISATVSMNNGLEYVSGLGWMNVIFDPEAPDNSYLQHIINAGGLDSVLTNITNSLTNLNLAYSDDVVRGQVIEQVVFVHVRWVWITLPAILVGGAAISLIIAIFESRASGAEVWKDSTLALLYHGIHESVVDGTELHGRASEVDKAAETVSVQLSTDEGGGRLMLRPPHVRGEKA